MGTRRVARSSQPVSRGPVSQIMQAAHTYLLYREQKDDAARRMKSVHGAIYAQTMSSTVVDDKGCHYWYFEKPVNGFTGFRLTRRKPPQWFDTEAASALVRRKKLQSKVYSDTVSVPGLSPEDSAELVAWLKDKGLDHEVTAVQDWDQLYVAKQRGKVTSAEIDACLVEGDAEYALNVLTDPAPDDADDDG